MAAHACIHCGEECDCGGYEECDRCYRCVDVTYIDDNRDFIDESDSDYAGYEYDREYYSDIDWDDHDPIDSDEDGDW